MSEALQIVALFGVVVALMLTLVYLPYDRH